MLDSRVLSVYTQPLSSRVRLEVAGAFPGRQPRVCEVENPKCGWPTVCASRTSLCGLPEVGVLARSIEQCVSPALTDNRSRADLFPGLANSGTRMMKKSGQCRTSADRITAASIIHGMKPQNMLRNLRNGLPRFPAISL